MMIGGSAYGADLPVPVKAPPPAVMNWSGCYVGVNAGGAITRTDTTATVGPGTHFPTAGDLATVGAAGASYNSDISAIGGGQVGCNLQMGGFVIGLEGDLDALESNPTVTSTGALSTGDTFTFSNYATGHWIATVRPRAGIAFDRSFVYVTGGAAFANFSFSQTYTDTLFGASGGSTAAKTETTWVAGVGWEWALTNFWTIRIEYLYAQFPALNAVGSIIDTAGGVNTLRGTGTLRENMFRLGWNWKLDWGTPVVAKY